MAALLPASAFAALRAPQLPVTGPSLQSFLDGTGESINVLTDQQATSIWRSTTSNNTSVTLQIEMAGSLSDENAHKLGLYNAFDGAKFELFDGAASDGALAIAQFRPLNQLLIHRFNADGSFNGTDTHSGVEPNGFGFYLEYPTISGDVFRYTEDGKNSGKAAALTFLGTGRNNGCWWVCFEDGRHAGNQDAEDDDFDDAILFVESVNTSPVSKATWASVKARFR